MYKERIAELVAYPLRSMDNVRLAPKRSYKGADEVVSS
jgi:hypothetical protein